jgi:predicted aspartyl protease
MLNQITFKYDSAEPLKYEEGDGHYHLHIPTFYVYDRYANDVVDFVFDTGAFLTVVVRKTAALFGFLDAYTIASNIRLNGFSGDCLADIKEIPGFIIGGRRLEGVRVAVPHTKTDMNILGLNVIEHFKYFTDTESDKIYFSENPMPCIPNEFRCNKIYTISK